MADTRLDFTTDQTFVNVKYLLAKQDLAVTIR